MKKLNTFSNTARLRTYLSLALGAGAHSMAEHNAHAEIITSPVNETSTNAGDPIFIRFSNGVISSGRGVDSGTLGTLTGVSGAGKGYVSPARIVSDASVTNPLQWSFVSRQPLPYGTTIDASTSWGGEPTSDPSFVLIDQGLSNAYYGLKFYAGEGTYHYGWMQVSTPGSDLTFGTAAVETIANTGIGAGVVAPVPEPSTVALLAMAGGAAALRLLRKKRAA